MRYEGFAYTGYLMRLNIKTKLALPKYVNYALNEYSIRADIEIPARSTSVINIIIISEVENLMIRLLSLKNQEDSICRVNNLFKLADAVDVRYRKAKDYADNLTQSIL